MYIRIAQITDVPAILHIRQNARENILRNQLTESMFEKALNNHCRAWVALVDDKIVGFSLANKKNRSIWGLFVLLAFQQQGIGKALLALAVNWLKAQPKRWPWQNRNIWVQTEKGSRAEKFYQHLGWQPGKMYPHHEIRYWYKVDA